MRRPDVYVLVERLRARVARPHLRVGHPAEDEDEEAVAWRGGGRGCAAAGAGFGGFVPGGACAAEGGCLWDGCRGFAA